MSNEQLFLILATIYLAGTLHRVLALSMAIIYFLAWYYQSFL